MLIRLMVVLYLFFISLSLFAETPFINRLEVKKFIKQVATTYHFKESELNKLFSNVKIRPKVMQRIRSPLEQKSWATYQMLFVTESRIREGVKFWNKYKDALNRAEKVFGVPASIIVATIGIETKYGKNNGEYPVIDALVNIGFSDSPRAPFFRKELIEFLLLSREQHLDPSKVLGSYAGAIGQPQFMPSSYRNFAINFSGTGKIDLTHNEIPKNRRR